MKISILQTAVLSFALVQGSVSAQSLPKDAQDLLKKQQESILRLNDTLNRELEKVKVRCMKDGNLEGANAVAALVKNPENLPVDDAADPLVGTVWSFQGVNRQKINEFTFLKAGKVKCESEYKTATWRRLDKNNILFDYGGDDSHIVLRVTDPEGKNMTGYHYSGRPRHIQRIK